VSHIYCRYYRCDFEGRSRKRLNVLPRWPTGTASQWHVEITHRFPAPNRYGWEIRPAVALPVEESRTRFTSWEEASRAGKLALRQFSTEG
jgi:hypothetical protein